VGVGPHGRLNMKIDVVNTDNKKVGSLELNDEVFGGRVNESLIWESVVHTNASKRRGTHATKNRALVSGGGKKPYKQKGTGRPQVGSSRTPLWRHGGTVFGPQPRSYDFRLPRKVKRGAIIAALAQRMQDGALVVVDALSATESKTKAATELLKRLGADGKALLIDVQPDEKLGIAVRNLPGVQFLASARVGARDVMNAQRIIATKAAVEKLQSLNGER
jgi:large subunit ribosomal protein L4